MEKPPPPEPSPLETALHAHINAISGRPLDPRQLLELEKTCRLTRELLSIGKAPDALRKEYLLTNPNQPIDPMSLYESGVGSYMPPSIYPGVSMATSNPTETFGVQAIKELIALLPGMMQKKEKKDPPPVPEPQMSYADMASAMALARGAGDDVLYNKLFRLLELEQERAELSNDLLRQEDEPPTPTLVETHSENTEAA